MIIKNDNEMTPKLWIELSIYLSSYCPLFVILFIKDISDNKNKTALFTNTLEMFVSSWAIVMLLVSLSAVLLTNLWIRRVLAYQEGSTLITIEQFKLIRGDMLNYTLPFLIGFLAFDYSTWQSILSLFVFLFFLFFFIRKSGVLMLNPMFLLIGVRLFEISYKKTGSNLKQESLALCLGVVTNSTSDSAIYIKDNAGVKLIFNKNNEQDVKADE